VNKARVEAVSDGVFAIAITLLVLTIPAPDVHKNLADELGAHWPSLAAYVVSFAVIGIMWFNHHSIFAHFARVDRVLFYLNLLLLMTIVFLPYPTGILGDRLQSGDGATTAAVFYSAAMTVNAAAWAAVWLYASSGRRLLNASFPEQQRSAATSAFTSGTLIYPLTIVVAFVNAYACLAVHAALAVFYAFDPVTRRAERDAGRSDGDDRDESLES
jgi:uncharacterized membrane protein